MNNQANFECVGRQRIKRMCVHVNRVDLTVLQYAARAKHDIFDCITSSKRTQRANVYDG